MVGAQDVHGNREGVEPNVEMEGVDASSHVDGMEDAEERRARLEPSQRDVSPHTQGIASLMASTFVHDTFRWLETGTNGIGNEDGCQPCTTHAHTVEFETRGRVPYYKDLYSCSFSSQRRGHLPARRQCMVGIPRLASRLHAGARALPSSISSKLVSSYRSHCPCAYTVVL